MQLWEQGKFELSDPLEKYLPEFANPHVLKNGAAVPAKRSITIVDLLSHTSGFTNPNPGGGPVEKLYAKAGMFGKGIEAFIETLSQLPLAAEPGEKWIYSLSSHVQGRLIEVLSDQKLDVYLTEKIFEPLQMPDTDFQVFPHQLDRFSQIYAFHPSDPLKPASVFGDYTQQPNMFSGGAGLVSTTMDYWKFAKMLAQGGELNGKRILKKSTVDLMTKDHLPAHAADLWESLAPDGNGLRYGLGFGIVRDVVKNGGYGVEGEFYWEGMANSLFFVDPASGTVAVVMLNMLPAWSLPLIGDTRRLVYSALQPAP